ncbi:unnamed protein product [Cyclocybe aegerita]|uniref:Uncharacterized protein n=1 Tax=Cyclocybe aegerita TaxID=1973307 RepID=A0A8S0XK36_CYCAE|nr:unnamed protein product [Cyclocybe aegerita]
MYTGADVPFNFTVNLFYSDSLIEKDIHAILCGTIISQANIKVLAWRMFRPGVTMEQERALKAEHDARYAWEAILVPWAFQGDFKFPIGTMSDAKLFYLLTERELLTIPRKLILGTAEAFVSQADVEALTRRKIVAGSNSTTAPKTQFLRYDNAREPHVRFVRAEPALGNQHPTGPYRVLTEQERAQAKALKAARDAKNAWEASLVPWTSRADFNFPIGTVGMLKSDAKSFYSLTEKEIQTIPRKTFVSKADVEALVRRKKAAGVSKPRVNWRPPSESSGLRLFKATENSNVEVVAIPVFIPPAVVHTHYQLVNVLYHYL